MATLIKPVKILRMILFSKFGSLSTIGVSNWFINFSRLSDITCRGFVSVFLKFDYTRSGPQIEKIVFDTAEKCRIRYMKFETSYTTQLRAVHVYMWFISYNISVPARNNEERLSCTCNSLSSLVSTLFALQSFPIQNASPTCFKSVLAKHSC